jgi:hypothetical protein
MKIISCAIFISVVLFCWVDENMVGENEILRKEKMDYFLLVVVESDGEWDIIDLLDG